MSIVAQSGEDYALVQMLTDRGLRDFALAYRALGNLLARVRNSMDNTPVMYRTPPGQTTVPQNSDHTGGSYVSGSSAESKPEPHVNKFATMFFDTAFITVSKWVQPLRWANPQARAHLKSQYVPIMSSHLAPTNPCTCASALHSPSPQ